MNKCKDRQHFKNDCGFSNVDEQLGLNRDFVGCGQFVKSKIQKDCLSCSNSFSEPFENGDILHCMECNGEVVGETDWCAKWN